MTFDYELTLISKKYIRNKFGVHEPIETKTTILCNKRSATANEYNLAGQEGLKPSFIFTLNADEYNAQTEVEFDNKRYQVIKTHYGQHYYKYLTSDLIELTVEEVVSNED